MLLSSHTWRSIRSVATNGSARGARQADHRHFGWLGAWLVGGGVRGASGSVEPGVGEGTLALSVVDVEPAYSGPSRRSSGRVLITHDWLVTWGGAERVLDELVDMFPGADVVTAIRRDSIAREHGTASRAPELWVGKIPGAR